MSPPKRNGRPAMNHKTTHSEAPNEGTTRAPLATPGDLPLGFGRTWIITLDGAWCQARAKKKALPLHPVERPVGTENPIQGRAVVDCSMTGGESATIVGLWICSASRTTRVGSDGTVARRTASTKAVAGGLPATATGRSGGGGPINPYSPGWG